MPLDFNHLQTQITHMGENAAAYETQLDLLRQTGIKTLNDCADKLDTLRERVEQAAKLNSNLRCAVPVSERLNAAFPLPPLPSQVTLLAADGSQINPDRHSQVEYSLINVGAIQFQRSGAEPPQEVIDSRLLYQEQLLTASGGMITEELVALMRDLAERRFLADLARSCVLPVVTLTDGQLELFREPVETPEYKREFEDYLQALRNLCANGVSTAGYVDKPRSDLLVRLMELAVLADDKLSEAGRERPLKGLTDEAIFRDLLKEPGDRSAVFAIRSPSSKKFTGELALHFFYLNVGYAGHSWLARVEIPAWVVQAPGMLDGLHAVLVEQSRIMGAKPFPYVLHRAHEVAVVHPDEKDQLENMIVAELRRRGVTVGEKSYKQSAKDLPRRYGRR